MFAGIGLAFSVVWWQMRPMRGGERLVLAFWLAVVGMLLVALRGAIADALSVIAGKELLVLSSGCVFEGTRAFFGARPRHTLTLAGLALVLVTFPLYLYREPSLRARIVIVSMVLAVIFAATAWTTHRRGRLLGDGWPAQLTALAFDSIAAVLALRAAVTLAKPAPRDLFTDAHITAGSLVVTFVCSAGWALGLITISNHRLERSVRDARELFSSLVTVARATAAPRGGACGCAWSRAVMRACAWP